MIYRDGQVDRIYALKSFSRSFSRVLGRFMYKVASGIINAVDQLVIEANKK
jgi:hypothetical protein